VILFLEAMGIEAAVQAARVEGYFFLEVECELVGGTNKKRTLVLSWERIKCKYRLL